MSREVKYKITADASGVKSGTKQAETAFKGLSQQTGQFFTSLTSRLNIAGVNVGGLGQTVSGLRAPLAAATTGVRGFGIALAATGIGAIVVALGLLVGAFLSTQRGADAISRVVEPLKFIFQTLIGVVQQLSFLFVDKLKAAFNDPIGSIKAMGQAIVDNIVNRFRALGESAGALGRILSSLFKRDLDGAKAALADLGDALLTVGTGVDDAAGKMGNFLRETKTLFDEATAAGTRLRDLAIEIKELEIEQAGTLARMNREYREQLAISADRTLSEMQQLTALQAAQAIMREITDERNKLLDLQIEELKIKQSANDTDREGYLELARLMAQRDENEASYQSQLRRTNTQIATLVNSMGGLGDVVSESHNMIISDLDEGLAYLTESSQQYHDRELELMEERRLANIKAQDDAKKAAIDRANAEVASIQRIMMMNMAQVRTIQDVGRATLDAMADAIAARIQEAAAIQFSKALASVPFPFNVGIAMAAAGTIKLLARSLFSIPGRSIRSGGGGSGGGSSSAAGSRESVVPSQARPAQARPQTVNVTVTGAIDGEVIRLAGERATRVNNEIT